MNLKNLATNQTKQITPMQILKHQLLSQKIKLKRQRYLLKPKTYSQKQNTILQKLGLSGYLALNTKKQSVISILAKLPLPAKPTMMLSTTTSRVRWQMTRRNICLHFYSILLNLSTLSKIQKTIISFWIP